MTQADTEYADGEAQMWADMHGEAKAQDLVFGKFLVRTYTEIHEPDADSPGVSIGFRVYREVDEDGPRFTVSQFDPHHADTPHDETEICECWEPTGMVAPGPPTLQAIWEYICDQSAGDEGDRYGR